MGKFLAFLGATLVAVSIAGSAAAGSPKPQAPDLSSPTAIANYLTSKGIDPATVVTQTGLNNYAGPSCPGVGWTCTTSTRVVQVAAPGGQNVVDCESPFSGGCIGVQQSDNQDTMKCVERGASPQHCMIDQGSPRNFARVDQLINQSGASPQDAIQTAHITQRGTEKNELQADQDIDQQLSGSGTQTQDAHQFALVEQSMTGNGNNFAHLHQAQNQDENGSATLQNQNTGAVPTTPTHDADADLTEKECVIGSTANGVPAPNECGRFVQFAVDGNNDAHLHQITSESEKSSTNATQNQGAVDNGLGGSDEQTISGAGSNHNETVQHKQENASSNGGVANQIDPIGCCGGSQFLGMNDGDKVHQFSSQSASGGTYTQNATETGRSEIASGGEFAAAPSPFSASGTCALLQHVNQNDAGTTFNESEPAPCSIIHETSCNSSNAPPPILTAPSNQAGCLPPSTDTSLITGGVALTPLDVTAEPASYTLPSWYVPF